MTSKSMMHTRTIDTYHFGFSLNLTESQLRTLTGFFHQPNPAGTGVLGGRTAVTPLMLEGIGPVVVKHYRRGGWMRHFIKRRYLKMGRSRARREFELLDSVRRMGIKAPQPVAYARRGAVFYLAWLVTRAIPQPVSLAEVSLKDGQKTIAAMASVTAQISALINNDILHVDLHPGNVVLAAGGEVYLLDFDKGRRFHGSRQKLKKRYLKRWQRAVDKHGLPEMLTEMMQDGLETTYR